MNKGIGMLTISIFNPSPHGLKICIFYVIIAGYSICCCLIFTIIQFNSFKLSRKQLSLFKRPVTHFTRLWCFGYQWASGNRSPYRSVSSLIVSPNSDIHMCKLIFYVSLQCFLLIKLFNCEFPNENKIETAYFFNFQFSLIYNFIKTQPPYIYSAMISHSSQLQCLLQSSNNLRRKYASDIW